jgi:hypothetical protein
MMSKHSARYFLLLSFLLACSRDLDLGLPQTSSQLVIESYLESGDSLWVRVDESASYYAEGNFTDRGRNATVHVSINGQTFSLIQSDAEEIWIDHATRLFQPTWYSLPRQTFTIPASGSFELSVQKDGRTATAFATMLPLIPITDFRPLRQLSSATPIYDAEVVASFPEGTSYFIVQQRLQIVRNDTIHLEVIHMHQLVSFEGNSHPQAITIRNERPGNSVTAAPGYTLRSLLRLMRIDKTYYEFYQATRQQEDDLAVDLGHLVVSEPTLVPTNIQGGFGIFTVMAVDTMSKVIP